MQRTAFSECGVTTYSSISGSYDANSNTFTITASQPSNQNNCDPHSFVVATSITETVVISGASCSQASVQYSAVVPGFPPANGSSSWQAKTPHFVISMSDYIPVDHVLGPSPCFFNGTIPTNNQLLYLVDAYRGTYRTTQSILSIPDARYDYGFYANTGATRNYGGGSPANGIFANLSSYLVSGDIYTGLYGGADEDNVQYDCHLWNNKGHADTGNMQNYSVSFPTATSTSVLLSGSAGNPLEPPGADISWAMLVNVDDTNKSSPTAYVVYSHTCYPAFNVKVNGTVIYDSQNIGYPQSNMTAYIGPCLGGLGRIVNGQTSPVVVPQQ